MTYWIFKQSAWWIETWFWLGCIVAVWILQYKMNEKLRCDTWAETTCGLGLWFQGMKKWWKKYPTMAFFYFLGGPVFWIIGLFKVVIAPLTVSFLWPWVIKPICKRTVVPAAKGTKNGAAGFVKWLAN